MNVHKIKIKNFKSIYDELIIDFDNTQGFWKISGPVGAGKTTIGEAIIFGLYGNVKGKNNSDLISWGEKSGYVELWCTSNNNKLYIKRDYKASGSSPIYVEVNSEPLIFTNKKDAQKQLETEYYDISRITLELLCIISFNNFKSLSSLNPAETKKFLDEVFGFYILTNYSNLCKEKLSESNSVLSNLKNEYKSIENKIEYIRKINNIERVDGNLNELLELYNKTNDQLKVIKEKYNTKRKLLHTQLIEQTKQTANIKTLGKKLSDEISRIKLGVCPTCGSSIDTSILPEKEQEKETLLKSYYDSEEIVKKYELQISDLDNKYKKKEQELNSVLLDTNSHITKLKEQEKRDNMNSGEIEVLNSDLKNKQSDITKQEIEVMEWSELNSILTNEIRSNIISSFIPRINSSIQSYSQKLNQPYIIEFDNQFKCNIKLINMENNIPISNLSTGQLKTVDMCIILGILDVIMNNVNFNICFLDELFSNMDGELRQLMCQVLKSNLKENQILFIISHIELDDKYFNGEIIANLEYVNNSILKKSKYIIHKL
jgi:DNA repair exonuclease SbcCD ATPase subunit